MIRKKIPNPSIVMHTRLLKKIAWGFHLSSGIDFEELYSEACYQWLVCIKDWQPSKGKVTTYMWTAVSNGMINYLRRYKKYADPLEEITRKTDRPVYSEPYYEALSVEGCCIAEIIIASPKQFIYSPKEEVIAKVKRIMLENGWNLNQVESGISNLESVFAA